MEKKNAIVKTYTGEDFTLRYAAFGRGKRPLVILPGLSVKAVTNTAEAVAGNFSAFRDYDLTGDLSRVSCPALVLGCLGDRVMTPEASRELAALLGCELFLYGEEYGHCVYDEAPDYLSRLLTFFEGTGHPSERPLP